MRELHWQQQCCIMQPWPDKCQSAEGQLCHFPESSDSMHCCWGATSWGALTACVCVYTCIWMGWRLRGSGMSGWVGTGACVWDCVCETMKAGSKSLHSWRTWVIWFSAVQKNSKLFYLKLCLTISLFAWNNRRYLFMRRGKSCGSWTVSITLAVYQKATRRRQFGSKLTWINH